MSKPIVVIPARGGSKRLPQKNILPLGGIHLIAHSILYAKKFSHLISEIYVSTNDTQIAKVAIEYGAEVIERPEAISGDQSPTSETLQHAVLEARHEPDAVILLQPTNPIRPDSLLEDALSVFNEKQCDSLLTVSLFQEKLGKIAGDCFEPFNYEFGQRSQDLEPLYQENGLLYITKTAFIKEGIILADRNYSYIVDANFPLVDIDTEKDFNYAKFILKSQEKK